MNTTVGFLRTLQGDAMTAAAVLAVVTIIFIVVRVMIKKMSGDMEPDDATFTRRFVNTIFGIIVAAVLLALFGHAAAVGFSNRVPRQDVDRSGVYEQMDSH